MGMLRHALEQMGLQVLEPGAARTPGREPPVDERTAEVRVLPSWAIFRMTGRGGLFPRYHIGRNHERVLGSCVPGFAKDCRFAEAGRFEFLQEGYPLLGARDSREPIRLAGLSVRWQRCAKNDLSGKDSPARSDHST